MPGWHNLFAALCRDIVIKQAAFGPSKAFEHDFALGLTGFDQAMRFA